MTIRQWSYISLLLGSLIVNMSVQAAEMNHYDRINFTVNAEREVENDTAIATLFAQEEGSDNAALTEKVNTAITWGIEVAKKSPNIEVHTLNYTTYPSYDDKGKITSWQVRQSLQIKSTDIKAMSHLLGALQEKLRIESVNYTVSPAVQRGLEEELITDALANFKRRADFLKEKMARTEYRVVQLQLQSGQQMATPTYAAGAMLVRGVSADNAVAPTLEAGKQTLRVDVIAEIELSPK